MPRARTRAGLHAALQRQGPDRLGLRPRATAPRTRAGKGYQVENGILYSTKEDGGNLYTEKEYADFVLRFDFKLTENANNGIGIRAPLEGDAAYVGIEIQVLDDGGSQYTKLQPFQYHGSIYGMVPPKRGFQKPVGEWNSEEITAKGRQITIKLNGTTIVDANLDDVKDEEMLKTHRDLASRKARAASPTPRGTSASSAMARASSSGTSESRSRNSRAATVADFKVEQEGQEFRRNFFQEKEKPHDLLALLLKL